MISTQAFGILRPVQHFYRSTFLFGRTGISWHGISVYTAYRWKFASLTKCTLKLKVVPFAFVCRTNHSVDPVCVLSCKLDPRTEQQATALYTELSMRTGTTPLVSRSPWHVFMFPFQDEKEKAELRATPLTNAKPLHHVLPWGWWDVKRGHRFEWTNAWRNILYPRLGMGTLLVSNDGATWIVFMRFSICCLSGNVGLSETLDT